MGDVMEGIDVNIGDVVVYHDEHGRAHDALVTAIHGYRNKQDQDEHYRAFCEANAGTEYAQPLETYLAIEWRIPSINVVFVSDEDNKNDPYGRQIDRATSVCHERYQTAHGFYWNERPSKLDA